MLYKKIGKHNDFVIDVDIDNLKFRLNEAIIFYEAKIIENNCNLRMNFWIEQNKSITLLTLAELNNLTETELKQKYFMRQYQRGFKFYITQENLETQFIKYIDVNQTHVDSIYDDLEKLLFNN